MATNRLVELAETLPVAEYDVGDPELYRIDSWRPYFKKLREMAPVHYCLDSQFGPFWSISTYDLAFEVELNYKTFSSLAKFGGIQLQYIAPMMNLPSFVSMDPPEPTGRRGTVAPIAIRSSLKDISDLIRKRTVNVLQSLPRDRVFGWVELASMELTSLMLATMFDYPQERRHELMHWSDMATANINAASPLVNTEEERYAELERMADAFMPLCWARENGQGGFDIISMLANSETTMHMDREEILDREMDIEVIGPAERTYSNIIRGFASLPVKINR